MTAADRHDAGGPALPQAHQPLPVLLGQVAFSLCARTGGAADRNAGAGPGISFRAGSQLPAEGRNHTGPPRPGTRRVVWRSVRDGGRGCRIPRRRGTGGADRNRPCAGSEVHGRRGGIDPANYPIGRMTYDLRRLRLHGIIERIPHSHRYRLTPDGLRIALFFSRTYARLLRPKLAAIMPLAPPPRSSLRIA